MTSDRDKDHFCRLPLEIKRQILQEFVDAKFKSMDDAAPPPITMHSLENFQGITFDARAPKLAPYATISPDWKFLIEEETFSTICLTSDTMDEAKSIMTSDRCALVRHVRLKFRLPEHFRSDQPAGQNSYLPRSKQQELNEAFTTFIKQSFDILSSSSFRDAGVVLEVMVEERGGASTKFEYLRAEGANDGDLAVYLSLEDIELPQLKCVASVGTSGPVTRITVYPASLFAIASRCPNLTGIHAELYDYSFDTDHRVTMRKDLAASLKLLPDTLECFSLSLIPMQAKGVGNQVADVTDPDPSTDTLSMELYQVGLKPKVDLYYVRGSFEPCVLGPDAATDDSPIRPCMKTWSIDMFNQTPSGQYLRTGLNRTMMMNIMVIISNGDGTHDVDTSPYAPAAMLQRAAIAAAKMPKLERMTYNGVVKVEYQRKKKMLVRFDQNACYKLDSRTKRLWQKVVSAHSGPDSKLQSYGEIGPDGMISHPPEDGNPNPAPTSVLDAFNIQVLEPGTPEELMRLLGL